jgi:hypothetical protein
MMQLFFFMGTLEPDTTYYWRIDTKDTSGVLHTGKTWSFHVMPVKATQESPADGSTFIVAEPTLSWKAGQNQPTHDVYFGADKAAVEAGDAGVFKGNVAETSLSLAFWIATRPTTGVWMRSMPPAPSSSATSGASRPPFRALARPSVRFGKALVGRLSAA